LFQCSRPRNAKLGQELLLCFGRWVQVLGLAQSGLVGDSIVMVVDILLGFNGRTIDVTLLKNLEALCFKGACNRFGDLQKNISIHVVSNICIDF
jgi:hypothetical protein